MRSHTGKNALNTFADPLQRMPRMQRSESVLAVAVTYPICVCVENERLNQTEFRTMIENE